MTQESLLNGTELRDVGMAVALSHANQKAPGWGDRAYEFIKAFAATGGEFRAEEVRNYAESHNFEVPPHARSWGAVFAKAARNQLIKRVGFTACENPKAHACNVSIWAAA